MVIESAERFGLAQLHQMRGRVGRRQQQAYCLLFANQEVKRLSYLTKINSGPELAKLDLKLRGPGELIGFKQHGFLGFRFAQLDNLELIKQTHQLARDIIKRYGRRS
jgi:ATP-dependent DNA helicase RecG